MSYVKFENIHCSTDENVNLIGLDLEIEKGSIYGILSERQEVGTLIAELISGITLPSKGTITINSLNAKENYEGIRKFTGVVSRDFRMYSYMSAHQNLIFFGNIKTQDPKFIQDRTSFLMHELNIWHTHDKKLSDLDTSSKIKLAIARALLSKPELLILDEPFSKLNRGSQEEVKNFITEIAQKENLTVIICSEFPEDLSFCDEYAILNGGKCIISGDFTALEKASGIKKTALIKCENRDLSKDLGMKKESNFVYTKTLDENEKIGNLIKSAALIDADITEAGIRNPDLNEICNKIIEISKRGKE